MNKKVTLSVIIPAFNEEKNYKNKRLTSLFSFLTKQKYTWEIIFVNDGSTDNTHALLNKLVKQYQNVKVITIPHAGKSAAITAGIMQARGEFSVFTDFDQSTPIYETVKVLQAFHEGADIVIARRKKTYDWPLPQRIRSRIFNFLVQIIILPGISDTQCGFKAFRTPIAQKLFKQLHVTKGAEKGRYMGAFDVEIIYLAKKCKYTIKNIDVDWFCVRAGSLSRLEPLKMLRDIIAIRIYDMLGKKDRKSAMLTQ